MKAAKKTAKAAPKKKIETTNAEPVVRRAEIERDLEREYRAIEQREYQHRALNLKTSAADVLSYAASLYQAVRSLEAYVGASSVQTPEVMAILATATESFSEIVVDVGNIEKIAAAYVAGVNP